MLEQVPLEPEDQAISEADPSIHINPLVLPTPKAYADDRIYRNSDPSMPGHLEQEAIAEMGAPLSAMPFQQTTKMELDHAAKSSIMVNDEVKIQNSFQN